MLTEGQVRQKLKQAVFRHRSAYLAQRLKITPANCEHNREHFSPRTNAEHRICIHPALNDGRICDLDYDGAAKSRDCRYFRTSMSKAALLVEFQSLIGTTPVQAAEAGYHDVAALRWVLGGDDGIGGDPMGPEDSSEDAEFPLEQGNPLPWYRRLPWRR